MVKRSDVLKVDNYGLLIEHYNQFDCYFFFIIMLLFYIFMFVGSLSIVCSCIRDSVIVCDGC